MQMELVIRWIADEFECRACHDFNLFILICIVQTNVFSKVSSTSVHQFTGEAVRDADLFTFFQSRNHGDCIGKVPFNFGYNIIMPPDDTFLPLYLSVELLAKIPHFIAVGPGGMLCLFFQSLDFFPTLGEFALKPLGLAPGETVGEITQCILAVGISLGFASAASCKAVSFSFLAASVSLAQAVRSAINFDLSASIAAISSVRRIWLKRLRF